MAWLAAERKLIDLDAWTPPGERRAVRRAVGQTFEEFADQWLVSRKTANDGLGSNGVRGGAPLWQHRLCDLAQHLHGHLLVRCVETPR